MARLIFGWAGAQPVCVVDGEVGSMAGRRGIGLPDRPGRSAEMAGVREPAYRVGRGGRLKWRGVRAGLPDRPRRSAEVAGV